MSLISETIRPSGPLQVERAIADFRGGYPVVLEEGGEAFLVQSIENLPDAYRSALEKLAGGAAHLVLSSARLRKLNITHTDIGCIPLKELDIPTIERLALTPDARLDGPLQAPVWADRVALELARLSLVLPAVIVIPLKRGAEVDPDMTRVPAEAVRRYRKWRVRRIAPVSRAFVPLEGALQTEFVVFRGGEGLRDQVAVIVGTPDLSRPVLTRLHSACLTGDLFGSLKCDCGDQLRSTVRFMAEHNGGILLYLDQEGRGNGIANKIRAYRLQAQGYDTFDADEIIGFDQDQRHFDFAVEMLRQLGVTQVRLMTNNPRKIAALREAGMNVVSDQRVTGRPTPQNAGYLRTKRDRAGHLLEAGDLEPDDEKT
ncbi:MAG: GTP cyclohydrolase II RibA [Methylobacteriaceae bacterium]|jgi:GTP cyclohydrolase II|nr:GTP cyclohydrolase II RibA [Methylobacteriaceae bacterium]